MSITKAEAQEVTRAFVRDYPGALELAYRFGSDVADLYGSRADEVPAEMKGGYLPKETMHAGRAYCGRVDVPLSNVDDGHDLLLTLRHEVLGHYGANTFMPTDKRALLDGLIAAREEPTLKPLWNDTDRNYAGFSLDVRAEEVFALYCEGIEPSHHQGADLSAQGRDQVRQKGQQSFAETCVSGVRTMLADDLHNIVCLVAQGLHDRSRTQQNFPQVNAQFRKDEQMEPKKPFHETVAEKLIEQLKAGTAPWQKPWEPGEPSAHIPMNPTTGKRYRGINAIQLMSENREDQRWLTYKQAAGVDAQVRKGEKGTPIQYWKFSEEQTKTDSEGKPVRDASGEPVKENVKLERPRVFFATVFNAEQIDGLPPLQPRKQHEWTAIERAEQILQGSGAEIRHGEQNRAFYLKSTDTIHMPDRGQFSTADNYYAIALHELGHWTGHESRLDRDLSNPFGSQGYAKEELRAEIASMILGDELGIGHDPEQHAAYVGSWIKALQEDPLEIFRAAADAEKIQDYVLGLEQTQVQQQGQQLDEGQSIRHPETDMQTPTQTAAAGLSAADARVAAARLDLARSDTASRESDSQAFAKEATAALGFTLPDGWTGQVQVVGLVERAGQTAVADEGENALAFALYARTETDALPLLTTVKTQAEVEQLTDRLTLIDAHSQSNEHEKAAKLARIEEERIRRDPSSTEEDISAAKDKRKDAEFNAVVNDEDLQRRIAEFERQSATGAETARPFDADAPQLDDGNILAALAGGKSPSLGVKTFIDVSFKEKDDAKSLGAKWDRQEQSWYIPNGVAAAPFAKWLPGPTDTAAVGASEAGAAPETPAEGQKAAQGRQYLAVPYGERVAAKVAGAAWDKAAKSWYAGPNADTAKLERWALDKAQNHQGPAMKPEEEFAEALRSLGCRVEGKHPIMDGARHRIPVIGDKKGEQAGMYVGHLDGHPAGYIKNNKTGIDMKWKSKGYALDPEQKAQLQADAAAKLQARELEQTQLQEQAAQRVGRQMADLVPIAQPTPYLQAKGIDPQPGALTDKAGQKTYIPATDVDGKQWTMQYIQEDGTKRFAKDSRKEGCFHVVGGLDALAAVPALVISEGYATAGSLSQSLGYATVAAFDSGNLPAVAKALREKYPDKPILIAGDDDRHLEITQGVNPGRVKAQEAAAITEGKVLLPIFAPGENAYPAGLPPVTPATYRQHQVDGTTLNPEQVAALDSMKRMTDYNDLATKSALGKEGIDRQVRSMVDATIERHQHSLQRQGPTQEETKAVDVQKQERAPQHQEEAPKQKRPRRAARVG